MILFLLKSSACLAIFLMFYKLLLEKERMHTFKRYYLLVTLALALVIPSITVIEHIEVTPASASVISPVEIITEETNMPITAERGEPRLTKTAINFWPILLWTVYGLGVLLFALKFLFNLRIIVSNVRNHSKVRMGNLIYVLLQDVIVPHTFLNYIFLNRKRFETKKIPKDVLVHEATHVRQRHSLDVLFVELLQIVFWFNPLVTLFKKSIKLNHEFLADQAVLNQGASAPQYQNTLLAFASSAGYKTYQPSMANAINYSSYSSIKKRFTIMKTQTSKKSILVRSFLLLPLLAILLYSFTETKTIKINGPNTDGMHTTDAPFIKTGKPDQNLNGKETSNRSVELAGLILDSETLLPLENVEIYDANGTILSKTDDKGYYNVQFDKLGTGEIRFEFSLGKEGYKMLKQKEHWGDLHGKIALIYYFGLQKEKSKFPEFSEPHMNIKNISYESIQNNLYLVKRNFDFNKKVTAAKKDNQNVLITIDNAYYIVNETGLIKINSVDDLISINDEQIISASKINGLIERKEITGMTPLGNNEALYAIYTIPVSSTVIPIKEASKEELRRFNALAKKYNATPKEKRIIPSGDLRILENIYGKMTIEQKANAQPFPECPDPKLSNQEGATIKQVGEYNELAKTYNKMLASNGNIRIKKSDVYRLEYLYGIMTEDQRAEAEPFPDFPEPPEPPMPPSPQKLNDEEYAEKIIEEIIVNQDPNDNLNNINLNTPPYPKMERSTAQMERVTARNEQEKRKIIEKEKQRIKLEQSLSLPPPAPMIATHVNTDDYSKELRKSIDTYLTERRKYNDAFSLFTEEQKGSIEDLRNMYNQMMGLYHNYASLAHKEDKFMQPVPFHQTRKSKTNNNTPPAPLTPRKPKSPLELLEELKKDNVKIILDGKEIGYEKAEKLFKESTFSRVNLRKEKGGRPVLEVSTD